MQSKPQFFDSPFFVDDPGNWHLKPGAPEAVQKEFKRFMSDSQTDADPVILDEVDLLDI